MPENVRTIGKELLHINQLIAFPKEGWEIEDWAKSITELLPDTEPEQVKLVMDCMKMGVIDFDRHEGVQAVVRGLKETQSAYMAAKEEICFRERRKEYHLKSLSNPEEFEPIRKLAWKKYKDLEESGRLGDLSPSERRFVFKSVLLTYGHRNIKPEDLLPTDFCRDIYHIVTGINTLQIDFTNTKVDMVKAVDFNKNGKAYGVTGFVKENGRWVMYNSRRIYLLLSGYRRLSQ